MNIDLYIGSEVLKNIFAKSPTVKQEFMKCVLAEEKSVAPNVN